MLQEERNVQCFVAAAQFLTGSRYGLAFSLWAQFIMGVRIRHSEGNACVHIGSTLWKEKNSCGSKLIFSLLCYLEAWTREQCSSTFRMSLLILFVVVVNNHRNSLTYIFMVFFYCDSFHYICLGAFLACVYEYHMCALCCQRSEKGIWSFGTWVVDGCDLSCGCWESNPGNLEEQLVLLTTELSI